MNLHPSLLATFGSALLLSGLPPAMGQEPAPAPPPKSLAPLTLPSTKPGEKDTFIPAKLGQVPAGNDFRDPESEFCFKRSKSSNHFLILWAKEYGDDPMANTKPNRRFNADEVLQAAELSYEVTLNRLKWAPDPNSRANRYKMLIIVTGGDNGTAYGGCAEDKVGVLWTPAVRINRGPYGVVAHELGHSFQGLTRADGAERFANGGIFAEMTSQYVLWQVFPEWQTFENYHLKAYLKATHLAFLHPDNRYHTCYPLEYWSFRHGPEFIGRMWREVAKNEDPVLTYQRLTKIDQTRFNDEMFDAARRFITWDMPRIEKTAARYADQDTTSVEPLPDGVFRIAPKLAPQNYGYNAIKLTVPAAGTTVHLGFKGTAGQDGASQVNLKKAGWRYGFLAHLQNGTRTYSPIYSAAQGTADYVVPADTKFLWLVVMGAPTGHWVRDDKQPVDEAWPYQFKLTGSAPDAAIVTRPPNG
ncbi:DUF6055 domain-containing protein [Luteolibacter sp. LG18]|uniref:DUF6055 domain-containing protein n=1 Tax=Luteolibacter sp. LG18 TaxID=2819286 RepID=UPI002B2C368D|nr:hypothetical protein llg_25460 [Luteolibacter sp. LG18]